MSQRLLSCLAAAAQLAIQLVCALRQLLELLRMQLLLVLAQRDNKCNTAPRWVQGMMHVLPGHVRVLCTPANMHTQARALAMRPARTWHSSCCCCAWLQLACTPTSCACSGSSALRRAPPAAATASAHAA